jgi:hypothetical protein
LRRFLWLIALLVTLSLSDPSTLSLAQATPVSHPRTATALRDANLRAGPGTNFAVVGGVRPGDRLSITGQNAAGDWYQLDDGKWIAAFLVKVEVVAPPATPTVSPTLGTTAVDVQIVAAMEALYIAHLQGLTGVYQAAFMGLEMQRVAVVQTPSLFLDAQWRLRTATILDLILTVGNDVRALVPPTRFEGVHNDFVAAAGHYDRVAETMINGLDRADLELFVAVQQEMLLGVQALYRANTQAVILQATPVIVEGGLLAPAATPLPPTPEPLPAPELATPTETPAPPIDTALIAYVDGATRQLDDLALGLGKLGELLANPQVGDELWTNEVATAMAVVRLAYEGLAGLQPPPQLIEAHTSALAAAAFCDDATQTLAGGLDTLDISAIQLAGLQVQQCIVGIEQAATMLPD